MTDLLNFINMHAHAERNGTLTIEMDDDFIVVSTISGVANYKNSYCKLTHYFTRDAQEFELTIPYSNLNKEGESLTDGAEPIVIKTVKDFPESYLIQTYYGLEISSRTANCLRAEEIFFVGDLIQKSERDLLRTPNLGRNSLNEIKEVLTDLNLQLKTKVPDWPPIDLPELEG
jgi:DNA-directed RNA polymerase alpha subunit